MHTKISQLVSEQRKRAFKQKGTDLNAYIIHGVSGSSAYIEQPRNKNNCQLPLGSPQVKNLQPGKKLLQLTFVMMREKVLISRLNIEHTRINKHYNKHTKFIHTLAFTKQNNSKSKFVVGIVLFVRFLFSQ